MAKGKSASTRSVLDPPNHQEQIRGRAFELYEERGREDGHELEDWLRAETEVTNTRTKARAT